MRFKLDENVDVRAEAPLSATGHDVATVVGQDLGGAADPVVAEAVRAEGRILVTLDRASPTCGPTRRAPTPASWCCGCTGRA